MYRSDPHLRVRRGVLLVTVAALAAPPVALLGGSAGAESPPNASAVRDWNLHSLDALSKPPDAPLPGAGQPAPVTLLHMAMVHGAIFDAVNAIDGGHEPYLEGLPAASPSASLDAAVATAAHDVLIGLGNGRMPPLPDAVVDRVELLYADALAAVPDGAAETDGIAAGAAAAEAMLAARAEDGRYGSFTFTVGDEPGEWRPLPPDEVNDPYAWVAEVEPFVLDRPDQFRTAGPQPLASAEYATEYNEVKDLGAVDSVRSPDQQAVTEFYTVGPVELFNRTLRTVAETEGLDLVAEARLFAMINLTGADTAINCWSDKAHWSNWRPVTAIHEGDNDGNDATLGDPTWEPMLPAPPYPEHTSGYNCATSAIMHAADAFFEGQQIAFTVVRIVPDAPDVTREYEQFSDVVADTIDARIYQGLHFRSGDVQGAEIGANVADWLNTHYLQPT